MLLALALTYSGFTALSLAMNRHYKQVFATRPSPLQRVVFKASGWALLVVAAWRCLVVFGAANGPIVFLGLISAAGLSLIVLLSYRPGWALGLAVAVPLIGVWV